MSEEKDKDIIIKVFVENKPYEINCDTGIQDIAWLSLTACYLYGQESFPVTTFIPIMATNEKGQILHPKSVIMKSMKEIGDKVIVKVRRKFGQIGYELSEDEKEWYDNAFQEGRFTMQLNISFRPVPDLRKEPAFIVVFDYEMDENLLTFFPPQPCELKIKVDERGSNGFYVKKYKVPMGTFSPKIVLFANKSTGEFDREITDFQKNELIIKKYPEMLTANEKEKYLKLKEEKIRLKELEIIEDIRKKKEEKEKEEELLRQLTEQMKEIPCSLEDIYMYVKSELAIEEQTLLEIFELLERNEFKIFRDLFQIFDDYCQLYQNNRNKTIDGTSEHNFLAEYLEYRPGMDNIVMEFQDEYVTRFEKDLDAIDFREFVYILIFLLDSISKHKDINILKEIESIYGRHQQLSKIYSYRQLFKNKILLNRNAENFAHLQKIFFKCGSKKDKSDLRLMSPAQLLNFVHTISKRFSYNVNELSSGEAKIDREFDFVDFLKIILAMSVNCSGESKLDDETQEFERVANCFEKFVSNVLIARDEKLLYFVK